MRRSQAAWRRSISIAGLRLRGRCSTAPGPISVHLKGPFIGDRNFGRIYLPVYPQQIDGQDPFALLQESIGVSPTKDSMSSVTITCAANSTPWRPQNSHT